MCGDNILRVIPPNTQTEDEICHVAKQFRGKTRG